MLTTGQVFCHHDLTLYVQTPEEYAKALADTEGKFVGAADSGALLIVGRLPLREMRMVYVKRDPFDACRAFCEAAKLPHDPAYRAYFVDLSDKLEAARLEYPGLTVDFDRLDDESVIRSIWSYVTKGEVFPEDHYRRMRTMRIFPDPAILQEVARNGRRCVLTPLQ